MIEEDRVRWGTWEELILGGAVLRHGSLNWDVISKEVQTRTFTPYLFTAKVCKDKYEVLQERYSGCSAWFEELRKRRVEELRRALEMSDDSIGSLESKLVSLKAEKGVTNVLYFKSGCNESSGKEVSKDGSSAGSFTHETETTWSKQSQAGTQASHKETDKTALILEPSRLERFPSIDELAETMLTEHGVSIKKRRGKRRRKDPREVSVGENHFVSQDKETLTSYFDRASKVPRIVDQDMYIGVSKIVGEADMKPEQVSNLSGFGLGRAGFGPVHSSTNTSTQGSTGFKKRRKELSKNMKGGSIAEKKLISSANITRISECKEKLSSGSGNPSRVTDVNCVNPCTSKHGTDEFTVILDSIMENEHASVFRRRLDSQKRARYRSIVRQHMDLDTIRSRIANKSIKSVAELLRDLLLVANNNLVFYSRITREYRCALVLRNLVTKRLHEYYKSVGNKIVAPQTLISPVQKLPAKPRSARPFNRKPANKEAFCGNNAIVLPKQEGNHVSRAVGSPSSAESSALTKKSPTRRGKISRVKRGNTGIQAETPMKVRKKAKDNK